MTVFLKNYIYLILKVREIKPAQKALNSQVKLNMALASKKVS